MLLSRTTARTDFNTTSSFSNVSVLRNIFTVLQIFNTFIFA